MKRTKIVCTIGPASETKIKIQQMAQAGLDVARLNFSHGTYKHHAMLIKNIRFVAQKVGRPLAILQDLQGPRIRTGVLPKAGVQISARQDVFLVPENYTAAKKNKSVFVPIQYPNLYRDIKPGAVVLIDDGKIELEVVAIKGKAIQCRVKIGDVICTHRGMNFPGSKISAPALTAKDKADLRFGLEQNVDFVALSFVKTAADVISLRRQIHQIEVKLGRRHKDFKKPKRTGNWPGTHTKIIAKIERPEAVKNFDAILQAADGIMVARGDLGLEIPLENLPLIQKNIINRCIQEAKPVIVATQMLDSMIRYPMPTRAEISDVANAILDGSDAIMLSGETATGKYPLKAVSIMNRIAHAVEPRSIADREWAKDGLKVTTGVTENVSQAVWQIAKGIKAKYIVCATTSGFTARSIIKNRPEIAVVALAASEKTKNQLALSWGVQPYHLNFSVPFNDLLKRIKKLMSQEGLVKTGDTIVISAGHPFGYLGQTNLIKVEII